MAKAAPFVAVLTLMAVCALAQPAISSIEPDDATGASNAVILNGAAPLVHTAIVLPLAADGERVGADDSAEQTAHVLKDMERILEVSKSGMDQIVRLNVYAANDEVVAGVETALAETFAGPNKPAVTVVVGAPAHPGALVAMDAIAATNAGAPGRIRHRALHGRQNRAHAAILPAGRAVYISGQAEPGDTPADATLNTLESLRDTLAWLELGLIHVVHVKTFMKPMDAVGEVDGAIDAFFEGAIVPPVTHVEWTNNAPIEVELIVSAPEGTASQANGPISYLTPPDLTASPVFCRVTVIDSDRRIYVAGLNGDNTESAEAEVRSLYGELGRILELAGSDMNHLVKATYYCATDATSSALNAIRPEFYDPERPPAASKALVRSTGRAGKGITVDMIAVRTE